MLSLPSIPPRSLWTPVAGLLLFCLVTSGWGLDVVSVVPADGAVRVDTAVTFQFEFDAPLDTTVRFEFPEGFFLSMFFDVDLVGDPDSISVSPDLMTVQVFNLHLEPDTRYVFGIIGAFSTTGDPLDAPVAFTFTTGEALPDGTVSGILNSDLGNTTGAVVALFDKLFDERPKALAVISSGDGTYMLHYVPVDTYLVAAAKDIDRDGEISPEGGVDIIAVFDPGSDGFPDPLMTSEGGAVTGIDMTLTLWSPITARHRCAEAEGLATDWTPDAYLIMAGASNVTPAGDGYVWIYYFYSPGLDEYYPVGASSIILWEWVMLDEEEELPDTIALPLDWVDSDVAADTAETHGGGQFRVDHPDAEVVAVLRHVDFFGDNGKEIAGSKLQRFQKEQDAVWVFIYQSEETGEEAFIPIDARTGEFIEIWQPTPTTVHFNMDVVTDAAAAWSPDAVPIMVGTHQSNLSPLGEAMYWFYIFSSAGKDSVRAFFASNGMFLGQGEIWEPPSRIALPPEWVDSDVVMATVEAVGGAAYRASNDSVTVEGGLTRNYNPFVPDDAAWRIMYRSITSEPLIFYVDAVTGRYMTDIETDPGNSNAVPSDFFLSQNSPNPFNVTTNISYSLPVQSEKSKVKGKSSSNFQPSTLNITLKVYNILGQEVGILLNEVQEPGYYTVRWDGRDADGREVSSGLYFYRLSVGSFGATKSMLLVR